MTPDYSRGYLRIPLSLWLSVFCRGALTRRQLQLVSLVIRESWGWRTAAGQVHTWTRPLNTRQIAEATELSSDHLRRDLCVLVERGVLREREHRYQFVPDLKLWTTNTQLTPKPRRLPPEWPGPSAESTQFTPVVKKENRKKRNVSADSGREFSTTGENASSRSSFARSCSQGSAASRRAATALRLAEVVAAFVGSLSPVEAEALRLWIYEAGIAAVWSTLEPAFRLGAAAGRRRLQALLAARLKGFS